MRVLILGGTGLISTGITRLLLQRGDEVVHFNRGKRSEEFEGRVRTIAGDRYDHPAFEAQMAEEPPFDCVIEMIAYAPEDVRSLVRAFGGRTGHLVFCSTVDVYARPASRYPIVEGERFRPTSWEYAQKKAECERILWRWSEETRAPFTVLRPVHTYSERGAVLHTFGSGTSYLDRLRTGNPIIVHGDGSSLWSSVHRDDAAAAFVNAIGNVAAFGKGYHLPGDECVTWNQYHEIVARAIGAPPPRIVHIPTDLLARVARRVYITEINFQYNNCFDPAAAKADLGYRYSVPMAEGFRRIYDWHVERGTLQDSDQDPYDDQILAAWEELRAQFELRLAGLDEGVEQT